MKNNIACIILAAGEGTRMKSRIPKVLHTICGKPMLGYVLELAGKLKAKRTIVVVGHKKELLKSLLAEYKVKTVYQDKLLGTADAVQRASSGLAGFNGNILILYGDQPLLEKETLARLLEKHNENKADATVLTGITNDPFGYGRIIRDNFSRVTAIVEEKDADYAQREIKEINTGIICFKKEPLLRSIAGIKPNNAKKEYYLTDVIKIFAQEGLRIESLCIDENDAGQAQGINTRGDLIAAQKVMRLRLLEDYIGKGVSIVDPESTFIDSGCKIGEETVIYPFTVIDKDVKIGKLCSIGPFCHLRSGTVLEDNVLIGNFTELVRTRIGKNTWMKHFSYLGDAVVGRNVNIGCGTVSANFDGVNKQKTVIEDDAFIGVDTLLRAPVRIGKKAKTGAGAVVIKDVKKGTVVVGVPARELKKA